jgi:hypothetical protein
MITTLYEKRLERKNIMRILKGEAKAMNKNVNFKSQN